VLQPQEKPLLQPLPQTFRILQFVLQPGEEFALRCAVPQVAGTHAGQLGLIVKKEVEVEKKIVDIRDGEEVRREMRERCRSRIE
jgi:hypothetical protein